MSPLFELNGAYCERSCLMGIVWSLGNLLLVSEVYWNNIFFGQIVVFDEYLSEVRQQSANGVHSIQISLCHLDDLARLSRSRAGEHKKFVIKNCISCL